MKISIMTICFNSEKHIEEAILSVVNQNYKNKEYIIIDGGSTDGTLSIVRKYKDKIDYFISEPDKGISDAFNKGIKASTGDVVCICNSDDIMADNVLSEFAAYYEEDVELYRLDEITRDFETGEEFKFSPTMYIPKIPFNIHLLHMGCYIKKAAFEKYGLYDLDFHYCMDLEWMRRAYYRGIKSKHVPLVCGYFRRGGASSSSEKKMRNERRQIVLRYGGNRLDAVYYVFLEILKKYAKKALTLFGKNTAIKIKSKSSIKNQ